MKLDKKWRFVVVAALVVGMTTTVSAFAGGDGSSSDPYLIDSCSQFNNIGNGDSNNYELVSDLDCSSIGNFPEIEDFSGSINGKFHTISNIDHDYGTTSKSTIGFISSTSTGAELKNLIISSSKHAYDGSSTAFLVGEVRGDTSIHSVRIENSDMDINGNGNNNAVFIGRDNNNAEYLINVTDVVSFSNSIYSGNSNSYYAGTLGATIYSDNAYFDRFAVVDGEINIQNSRGALFADFYGSGSVSNGYVAGSFSGTSDLGGSPVDAYYEDTTSISSGSGVQLTSSEVKYPNSESNMDFDFTNDWVRDESTQNQGYPFLRSFCGSVYNCNTKPKVNSKSVSPDPPLIGENVSYSAEVYDSDGSIDKTNLTLEYGGSTVVSDEKRTGTSPSWNDIYKPSSGNKWLNATLEVVDDKGAVTTKEIDRFLSDDAPSVSISNLNNQSYFSYSRDATVSVSDSDSKPNEDITCSLYIDSNQYDTRTVTEGNSFTTTTEADFGSHTFKAECSDPAGNTNSKTVDYTVDAAQVQNVNSVSQVYETENRTYELDLKTGDMVNSADIEFIYGGSTEDTKNIQSNGVETLRPDFYYEVPLVSNNQTTKNWEMNYDLNITDLQSSTTSTISESTNTQTQTVLWSYFIENSDTDPSNGKYIETEDLKHDVKVHTETKKADLEGTTTYNRNNEQTTMTVKLDAPKYTTLRGVIDVGLADSFNQSSFTTESSVDVSFNGGSRTLTTGTDTVEVYKIRITDGTSNLNTAKALKFDVDYEEEGYDAETKLTMDLSVFKNMDEKIRRYQFQEDAAQTHSFNIYPSWAEYKIRTLPYPDQNKFDLIQYFNQDTDKVRRSYFFPQTQTISNSTTTVPLKTINRTETQAIDFEITNSDGDPAQNTYCRVDRKFGGGDFETVFQVKTGSEGKSQSFAEVNEIYYSFTCYKNGEIADQFAAQIMQNPMRLDLGGQTVQTGLNFNSKFDASCSSNTTTLECDYQSSTEKLSQAVLTVERNEIKQDIQVCEKTSPTATGKLVCNGLNTTENSYNYELTGQYPETTVQGTSGFLGTQSNPIPGAGLFMTAILFMLTTAATAFDLRVGIASGTLVFILTSMINWIVLNPSQQATLIGMAIIAGVAVSQ